MRKELLFALAAICIATLVAGCGGGGNGGAPGTLLTIGADVFTGATAGVESVRADTTLIAPLDPGTLVVAYDFETGKEVARGTLDSTGWCTLRITPGLTVAVVATGTRNGKNYRFSTIIPQVPVNPGEYVLKAETTIAAEAIAQKFFKTGTPIDEDTFNKVVEAARAFVQAHVDADYSLEGNVIGGTAFGASNSLSDEVKSEVEDEIPGTIDEKLVMAKQAVQQIREAGVPIEAMVSQEPQEIENIFTNQVTSKYSALFDRLSKLIVPAISGNMTYGASENISVFELTMGQAYKATAGLDGRLSLENTTGGEAGKIIIFYSEAPAGTYKLTATKAGSTWTVKQTLDSDPAQAYVVTLPEIPETGPGANPSFTGTVSLKDSVFTSPLTFNGTISASGPDKDHYSQVVFQGSLDTPNLDAQGRFQANFLSSLPSGASPDDSIYDYLTSASMTNASITAAGGGTTLTIGGNISISQALVTSNGYPDMVGKHVEISGSYSNSHSGLNFEGNISFDRANPEVDLDEPNASATLVLHGELVRSGHPTYYADMRFTLANSKITSQIDLRAGSNTLAGTGSLQLSEGEPTSGSLTLTNQSGVEFAISRNASGVLSGTVKVGGETKANITMEGNILKVTYTDGTFDAFEL